MEKSADIIMMPQSSRRNYVIILIVWILVAVFLIWASRTHLDLVTRGSGRVIAAGQNKNVQSPQDGSITGFFVEEGSLVTQNSILATINPTEAQGLLEELQARLSHQKARLMRLEAELDGRHIINLRQSLAKIDPTIVDAEVALMRARDESQLAKLKTLQQERAQNRKELAGIVAELQGRQDMLVLLLGEMKEVMPLVEMGALGSSEKYRLRREEAVINTATIVLQEQEKKVALSVEQITGQIDALHKEYRTEIYQERAGVIGQISELTARLPAIKQLLNETDIRSPIDGVVNRVFFNNIGAVLRSGEVIAEIVPTGKELLIEAFIDPADIATVEPGQSVQISLTAYEPSRYGYLQGWLIKVAADTIYREETRSAVFAVTASMDKQIYQDNGAPVTIVPGMIAQVDIIRGDRTVLEYFWQPVAKIKDNAFRE